MARAGTCDLCGLPILGGGLAENDHRFCCEGCQRVWRVAEEAGIGSLLDSADSRTGRSLRATERRATLATASGARRETLHVGGMWCASCALVLEDALMDLPGVLDAQVSYAGSLARVIWDPAVIGAHDISVRIGVLGYVAKPAHEAYAARTDVEDVFLRFVVSVAVGMWVMWPTLFMLYPAYLDGLFTSQLPLERYSAAMSLVVLLYCGWPFLRGAWHAARVRRATMDTLVVLGTWSAWFYSLYAMLSGTGPTYFESATMITSIVLLGRWIEVLGSRGATSALAQLAEGSVEEAWAVPDGRSAALATRTPLEQVAVGTVVAVRAGERIPADGIVIDGASEIDRSRLTGEPIPALHGTDDEVWAGTLNLTAMLLVRVTRVGSDTLSGRLGALMEDAVFAKSNTQRLVDAISRVFVPVVIAIAVAAAFISIVTGPGLAEGISRAVAVLVVACPCALGLATPLATSNAIGAGARSGLLIRGGPTLERSEDIAVVAFDKTGTLTQGRPQLVGAIGPDGEPTQAATLAEAVAPLELGEPHPVAQAIVDAASAAGITPAADIDRRPGLGLMGTLANGVQVVAGSEALMAECAVAIPEQAQASAQSARDEGELVIWVARDSELMGGLRFADPIRDEAAAMIDWLRERGIRTALVSGDSPGTCASVARRLGIDLVFGGVLPHEKDQAIGQLGEMGPVAFVGDGVNDAAALAAADLAIAVGEGSDVAVWGADIVLLGTDASPLASIPPLMTIARSTRRVIRQNLIWAFSYNLVTVPLAVSGKLSPIVAAAAMALSSLAVVANSARLSRSGMRETRGLG